MIRATNLPPVCDAGGPYSGEVGRRVFQVNSVLPRPGEPGGSQTGTVSTAFDCFVGPNLVVIGRLVFTTGDAGCLSQVRSCYPLGVYTEDCDQVVWQIDPDDPIHQFRLGRICIGAGGNDACRPPLAVQETTWGRIKASFR